MLHDNAEPTGTTEKALDYTHISLLKHIDAPSLRY